MINTQNFMCDVSKVLWCIKSDEESNSVLETLQKKVVQNTVIVKSPYKFVQ